MFAAARSIGVSSTLSAVLFVGVRFMDVIGGLFVDDKFGAGSGEQGVSNNGEPGGRGGPKNLSNSSSSTSKVVISKSLSAIWSNGSSSLRVSSLI